MNFNHTQLPDLFENIKRMENLCFDGVSTYSVHSNTGYVGLVRYTETSKTWFIEKDNFPMPRTYFETNFPIETEERFVNEMNLIGIVLVRQTEHRCKVCHIPYATAEDLYEHYNDEHNQSTN